MKVRLLHPIEDVGTKDDPQAVVGLKASKKRNRNWVPPHKDKDGTWVESKEPQFHYVAMTAGTVVECSDATGQKWIDQGKAEKVEEPPATDEGVALGGVETPASK